MPDEIQKEKAQRLAPTKEVLRELFLKSGNLCAFPGCNRPMMNQDGQFIGQMCHIEAAEPGGERFNPDQTNEQRRSFENLLLLCYEHHVVTNDVPNYPVERLREIKTNHEKKVFDFIENIQLRVPDLTAIETAKPAKSLEKFGGDWKLNAQEIAETVKTVNALLQRIARLPKPVRELLVLVVDRATPVDHRYSLVSIHELQLVCGLGEDKLSQLLQVLDNHGFIREGGPDDYGHPQIALWYPDGWPIWNDFKDYAKSGRATLHEILVNLNFELLD